MGSQRACGEQPENEPGGQPRSPSAEEWRAVAGWPYEVSDLGRVRRASTRALLAPWTNEWGYLAIVLSRDGEKKHFQVHRLVADAFLGPRPPRMETNHIDGDKVNAAVTNLEYVTAAENIRHAVRAGLRAGPARGATARQLEVLRAIDRFAATHGYPPTVREVCGLIGTTSTNGAAEMLESIERKGLLTWQRKVAHTLRVTDAGHEALAGPDSTPGAVTEAA